jgi:drug/metabolite transporter (DMT)-like permease
MLPASMSEPASPRRVALALGLLYLFWGTTYFAIHLALAGFPPVLMAGSRFTAAGALLYLALRLRGEPDPPPHQWGAAALVGALLLLANLLVTVAEQWVSSSLAAVVVASTPLWVVLLAGLWREWPVRAEWLGLGVGLAGVLLLQSGGELRGSPLGAFLLLVSTWSWALGSTWSRKLPLPGGLMAPALQMMGGGVPLLAVALLRGERPYPGLGWRPVAAWVWLLIFGSLVGYVAYTWLLRRVRPALATSYAYVNPAVAVTIGAAAGERVGARALVALALILGGVAVVAASRRARPAEAR